MSGIYETNLSTGKRNLLYRHSVVDVGSVLVDDEGEVYGATFMDGYPSIVYFKGQNKQKDRLKYVKGLFPNSLVSPSNMSDDETKQTFLVTSDNNPGIFYLVDTANESVTPLGKFWGSIDYSNLANVEPFSFKARDGATIHGYITKVE